MTPDPQNIEQQEENPAFVCAECNAPVVVFNGKVFRECEHDSAAVIANLSAIVYGKGSA